MLHYIKGRYTGSWEDCIIVENGGLGYKIHVSERTEKNMPPGGGDVCLYLHLILREDTMSLYGFLTEGELGFFRSLLTVSGIGPRVALSLLGSLTLPELQSVIGRQDTAALTRVKGVGKKTAQRIILELKDRLPAVEAGQEERGDQLYEAREALLSLGYSMAEAADALARAAREGSLERDELLKKALKYLAEGRS